MNTQLDEFDPMLIARVMQGDAGAFERLVECYQRPMFNLAYRMLDSVAEAADATQSVFLKVFEHLREYDSECGLFSWVYRIAVNESIDRLRRRGHGGTQERIDDLPLESGERSPEELCGDTQMHDLIQSTLMELQPDYRAVIVLRHFAECDYAQIAEILKIPEKTVKSRLYSARQVMRDKLHTHGVTSA